VDVPEHKAPQDRAAPKAAATAPLPAPRSLAMRSSLLRTGDVVTRRAVSTVEPHQPCRADELGVIERFLAERGVTRCPDVRTIEKSPLPALTWDKVKRKWVRPSNEQLRTG
jgi:hypothetical protein